MSLPIEGRLPLTVVLQADIAEKGAPVPMQTDIPYFPLQSSARGLDFSVSSSSSLPISEHIHYHDYFQIYYIRQGYLFHHVGDRHLKLTRGDCFINSPHTPHRIEMGPSTAFISFSFRESFIPASITTQPDFQRFTSNLQFSDLNGRIRLQSQDAVLMDQLMQLTYREFCAANANYQTVIQSILAMILVILMRFSIAPVQDYAYFDKLMISLDYINTHFSEDINAVNAARIACMSQSSYYRAFKNLTGQSFKQYLSKIRIQHACKLLTSTDLSLSTIALQCGFNNYSSFYRLFMKECSLSPYDYRASDHS